MNDGELERVRALTVQMQNQRDLRRKITDGLIFIEFRGASERLEISDEKFINAVKEFCRDYSEKEEANLLNQFKSLVQSERCGLDEMF